MHRSARRVYRALALTLACAAGFGSGCASLDASERGTAAPDYGGDGGGANLGFADASPGDGRGDVDAEVALNDLCGGNGFCGGNAPDDPAACADYDPGGPRPDAGRDASAGGAPPVEAGHAGSAGDSGFEAPEGGPDAGRDAAVVDAASSADGSTSADGAADGEPPGFDAGGDGASPDATSGPTPERDGAGSPPLPTIPVPEPTPVENSGPPFACQVGRDDYGNAIHHCGRAGGGVSGDPCASSGECRAGLACVGAVGAGQCLPYCCHPGTVCPGGEDGGRRTFCADRPLLEGGRPEKTLQVPVCAPAEECRLLDDPYPCTGGGCSCGAAMACAVVGDDGTTACVTPGTGTVGAACPCAAGYYCSGGTSKCAKLCKTAATDDGCAPGRCAAAAGLPAGFGLCVGAAPLVR